MHLSVVIHACSLSIHELEWGEFGIQGQLGPHHKTLAQKSSPNPNTSKNNNKVKKLLYSQNLSTS